jgi:hypothetical protein
MEFKRRTKTNQKLGGFKMKNIACRTSTLGFLVLLVLGAGSGLQGRDRQVGDVFVAIGGGQYQVWHFDFSTNPLTATLVETITDGAGSGQTAGCAFDSAYHPFTTNFTKNDVFKDIIDDPQTSIQTISVLAAKGAQPTSVAFDSLGNSYVGVAGGNGLIEEYAPNGSLVQTLPVNTSKLKGGSAWMDLSANGKTIYFTNGTNTISQFAVSSSKISNFAGISGATLYALRVLPTATANGGILLVAAVFSGSSNIQLLNASGATIQTYSVGGENNFQVLTLDPNGTSFWAGNPTTNNFYRFNLGGASEVGPINTGPTAGPSGLCAYGGFSAAQPQPTAVTTALTSGSQQCTVHSATNTMDCTFSTPVPDLKKGPNNFAITLNGINLNSAPNGVQLTYNYSQICGGSNPLCAPGAGASDAGLACDLMSPNGDKCEVHSVDVSPINGGSATYNYDLDILSVQSSTNPEVVKNEAHNVTDFVIHGSTRGGGSGSSGGSIFTVNEQPIQVTGSQSCGYTSPLINSQYNKGRTIPFKFQAVTSPNTCASGPFVTNLNARLVLLQTTNLSTPGAAPQPVPYNLSNGTQCPATGCYYRLDTTSNTWILNVDTSMLQGGGTQYFGTTFDDSNQIPSFSNTTLGLTVTDFFTVN